MVQIYVDDIIFASTNIVMCDEFANQMTNKFKMSMMGQMPFFLGLQISQSPRGIFINQSKYASEIVKKYGLHTTDSVDTPMIENKKLDEDLQGKPIDATLYRGMIESLMYLTSSRPNLNYVNHVFHTSSQTKLDLELVPKENIMDIGKCKAIITCGLTPRVPTFQVTLDAIALTPCYPAFLITADVPEVFSQEYRIENLIPFPSEEDIVSFLRELGHSGEINSLNDVFVDQMHQPWRTFAALIN
ncbi:retrovirus-related pol polyprotein from transposon TNT 1-94 [Tanacetum coccineum]